MRRKVVQASEIAKSPGLNLSAGHHIRGAMPKQVDLFFEAEMPDLEHELRAQGLPEEAIVRIVKRSSHKFYCLHLVLTPKGGIKSARWVNPPSEEQVEKRAGQLLMWEHERLQQIRLAEREDLEADTGPVTAGPDP